jgi:hypothetical protein
LGQSGFLLIPDSSSDSIGKYSAVDGSLIDANFIVDAASASTYDFTTVKEAIQVGNQIWASDQVQDAVFIFDMAGNYVDKIGEDMAGNPTGEMDNIRGLAYDGSVVFVANSGTNGGAPGDAIVTINPTTLIVTGNFVVTNPGTGDVTDPFDVEIYQGNLLISDIAGGTDGEGFDLVSSSGTYLSRLVSSDAVSGIDFPQQASAKWSDSNFLAAGFSAPFGMYEYDSSGNQINYFPDTASRGVFELQNGNYLYTGGSGTFVYDVNSGDSTLVGSGSQYISFIAVPEPGTLGLISVVAVLTLGRRRRTVH